MIQAGMSILFPANFDINSCNTQTEIQTSERIFGIFPLEISSMDELRIINELDAKFEKMIVRNK